MNRRQLFTALAAAAVAPGELWKPQRTIFLPPRGGWLNFQIEFVYREQFDREEFLRLVAEEFRIPARYLTGQVA